MKYLSKLLLFLFYLQVNAQQKEVNPLVLPYTDFLENQNQSAKDYVLSLFDKYDYIILTERLHYEKTQYDFIVDLISDKRFINKVGTIFTEVGVSTQRDNVQALLQANNLSPEEVKKMALNIFRDIEWLDWDKSSYYDFLIKLYDINSKLEPDKKLKLEYADVPFSWENFENRKQYIDFQKTLNDRDSIMASQIISTIKGNDFAKDKRHKALIILNYRHGFTNIRLTLDGPKENNTGRYLKEYFQDNIASVLINTVYNRNDDNFYLIQNGKWDAAFELTQKNNIGFNFVDSPFGKDAFDLYPIQNDLTYKDVFQGFIYTSSIDSFIFEKGVPNFITDDFKTEFQRRSLLQGYEVTDKMIEDYNNKMEWRMSETQWCPNYDELKKLIENNKYVP